MITVKELIKMLQSEDEDAIVMLSCDSEGNCFSPLEKGFARSTKGEEKDTDIYYNRSFNALPDDSKLLFMYPMD